ncbi:DUF6247 family protein [Streptomyces sp. NBC_00335]|uniref:DUF6247 family protein n=1 Tax=unclassified Streptomyces TaxID=2593676 RepID=UPI00224D7882|nr:MULTISPECIES: DUF6247 family protein [unclassified Streptomyces]MCX5409875.1 DUF6247 family protein [Streptomyces sp. NBC_00086]
MSAQPVYPHQPPPPPAPAAAARLRTRIAGHDAAGRWLPAFDRDWDAALEESRATYDLSSLHEVVREWQGRLDTAPAVAALVTSGYEDTDSVALEDIIGARR